jgi:hypothetical protein
MKAIRAVLTGDMVGSGRRTAADVDLAMASLEKGAIEIENWGRSESRFTRFRGDGWQLFLHDPHLSLLSVLTLTAHLKASGTLLDTRIAIGFGSVDNLGSSDLNDASGEVFSLSGHALDNLPRHRRIALADPDGVHKTTEAIFEMATWIASRWTTAQAEAVMLALGPEIRTQAEIAGLLSITQQAVQKRLSGAGWDVLSVALEAVRHHRLSAGA